MPGFNATRRAVIRSGPAPVKIGGVEIGTVGRATYNTDYILSGGDDFEGASSIIAPATPFGKYATTRGGYAVSNGGANGVQDPRGSGGLAMYDTDPAHTGYLDSNRGAPVAAWSDMIAQQNSELTLKARSTTASDQPHMLDPTKKAVGSMIHTGARLLGMAPVIFEWREKRTSNTGSHITSWLMQSNDFRTYNDVEIDFEANSSSGGGGDGKSLDYNNNIWTAGSKATTGTAGPALTDGAYYTYAARIDEVGDVTFWLDTGAGLTLRRTYTGARAAALARAFYLLFTNHAYQAGWQTGDPAAYQVIDWYRVWRKGGSHFKPLSTGQIYRADFGAVASFTLPAAAGVWGAAVAEVVEALSVEANEPGGDAFGNYAGFPAGITYNTGTRVLALDGTTAKPGRLHLVRYAAVAGSTCEPARMVVEIGPKINVAAFTVTTNVPYSFDLYAACDVGQILPKVVTVSGLPSGLSFSAATGLITGTVTANGTANVTINVTNASGQTASKTVTATVAAATSYAYEGWAGPAWYDASDVPTLTVSTGNVSAVANKRAGGGDLTMGGNAATHLTTVAAAQNNKAVLRVVRDVSATNTETRLSATAAAAVSQAFQGNDKPYTVIVVFKPTDTNTRFIWSASASTDATNAEQIALVSRNASASSVRRAPTIAPTNDVSWGAGQASGGWHIVAVQHTGVALSVWDTSLTKSVNAAAQDTTAFSASLAFRLFAIATNAAGASPSTPIMSTTQGNLDFAECIVESTARSDADIQQAITDLATKWGIALV